jgi:CRISPR/Cas system CSM-associated protein Csm2 small subunit
MGTCKECGKNAFEGYEYCPQCYQAMKGSRGGGGGQRGGQSRGGGYRQDDRPHRDPPGKQYFQTSFYDQDGYLRREVNIEAAEEAVRVFRDMTQSSIRQLFQMLKSVEARLDTMEPGKRAGFIREQYGKFVSQVEYQSGRKVIPFAFKDFARAYYDIASSSEKEFRGFVQFLTAILARMKTK